MSTNIGCLLEQPLPSGRGSGRCNRRRFLPDLCRNRLPEVLTVAAQGRRHARQGFQVSDLHHVFAVGL